MGYNFSFKNFNSEVAMDFKARVLNKESKQRQGRSISFSHARQLLKGIELFLL